MRVPRPKDRDELRALRWEAAKRRLALLDNRLNRPKRLIAWYLTQAAAARGCMLRDSHPGRWWWKRQWSNQMGLVHALAARTEQS